jgi:chemotaxis protein CheD
MDGLKERAREIGPAQGGHPVPKPDFYLHAERVFASERPCTVMTILGSCVSVCLWDGVRGIGGMNHFLLPRDPSDCGAHRGRYGMNAFNLLLEKVLALGCRKADLRGKVFGGARIMEISNGKEAHLGQMNADLAFAILEKERIPVLASDVGGPLGRKVLFRTSDGIAWVKKIGGTPHGNG